MHSPENPGLPSLDRLNDIPPAHGDAPPGQDRFNPDQTDPLNRDRSALYREGLLKNAQIEPL